MLEKIVEARKIRFIIYLIMLLSVLMYRAYEGDREGMLLCMAVIPMALFGVVTSE